MVLSIVLFHDGAAQIFGDNRTFLVYLTICPYGFVGDPFAVSILPKSLLYSIFVLSYVFCYYLVLIVSPFTFPCSMHFTAFPLTIVTMIFALECANSFNNIVTKLSLVFCSVSIN